MSSRHNSNPLKLFLLGVCIAYAGVSNADESLVGVHASALVLYKKGDVYGAYQQLNSFISTHDNAEYESELGEQKFAEILNDYAFFMEKYYEEQTSHFCKAHDASSKDFMIFRSRMLDDAAEVLLFVTQIDPDRSVAYLNLADVLYEMDLDNEAEQSYKKYASLRTDKKEIMPRRVLDPSARKKLYRCR